MMNRGTTKHIVKQNNMSFLNGFIGNLVETSSLNYANRINARFVNVLLLLLLLTSINFAQPVVENVSFTQRTDGSFKVDIYYDVNDTNNNTMTITVEASSDNGTTWNFTCAQTTGDVGSGITSGTNKHIEWDFAAEHPNSVGDGFRIKILADNGIAPEKPILSSPTNGATDQSTSPTLIWNSSNEATSYTLQISTNSSFSSFVYNESGLTSTSQQVTGLNNSTTYYWRVNASNSYGTSGWSSTWSFTTTGVAPEAPILPKRLLGINEIGGFEGDMPSYWTKGNEPGGSTLTWATDEFRSMGKSLKITKDATDEAAMWTSENMVDFWSPTHMKDRDIYLGAYVRTEDVNTNPATDDEKWYLSFTFYDESGALIGETKLDIDQSTASSNGWVETANAVRETILPRDSYTTIFKFVGGKDAVGTVWADDFMLYGRNDWAGQNWNTAIGVPTGWIYWLPPSGGNNGELSNGFENTIVTDEEAHSGLYSLKFDLPFDREPHDAWVGTKRISLSDQAINPGDVIRISVWIKASNLVPDSAALYPTTYAVGFKYGYFKGVGNNDGWNPIDGFPVDMQFVLPTVTSFGWTQYYIDVQVPNDPEAVAMSVRLHAYTRFTGTVYWDDLKVEKITQTISVVSPNGGESWEVGSSHNITWTSSPPGRITNVKIEYSTNNGTNWTTEAASTAASAESYSWTIPNTPSTNCKVKISDASDGSINDVSDETFRIYQEQITIAEAKIDSNGDFIPDLLGQTVTIKGIIITPNFNPVTMQYFLQDETGGINLYASFESTFNIGDEVLITGEIAQFHGLTEIIPATATNIMVISTGNDFDTTIVTIAGFGESIEDQLVKLNNVFLIDPGAWPTEGNNTNLEITDGVNKLILRIDKDTDLDGWANSPTGYFNVVGIAYQYTDNSPPNDGYQIMPRFIIDISIVESWVNVISPNGGENWQVGSTHDITWMSSDVTNVKIEYSTNNGTNWTTEAASTAASAESYSWTIPNTPSTNCKVKISDVSDGSISDVSDSTFTISEPTVIVTNSAADSGPGTLRQALLDAENGTIINFGTNVFPPDNPTTISLTSGQLPAITQGNITIDASNAGVILDGSALSGTTGIYINSDSNKVRGLQIQNFNGDGIGIRGDNSPSYNIIGGNRTIGAGPNGEGNTIINCGAAGIGIYDSATTYNTIIGNYVGIDVTGTVAMPNGRGINIRSPYNTIGSSTPEERNVVSGNTDAGVWIETSFGHHNTIIGNYIGTNASGTDSIGNSHGIFINNFQGGPTNNTIGGNNENERNLISGNHGNGVVITDVGTNNNTVIGNYIGVDISGTQAIPNNSSGIFIWGAKYNMIGGSTSGYRNVISGNTGNGIEIDGVGTDSNMVKGNYIGTDVSGSNAISNGGMGVVISHGAQSNILGGNTPGERNVISGNNYTGIEIYGLGTDRNIIQGNYIGTDETGTVALGNYEKGIFIFQGAKHNIIGGLTNNARNLISGNNGNGVQIEAAGTDFNRVSHNSIYSNVKLGINLDGGANNNISATVITSIDGSEVSGTALPNAIIEIFADAEEEGKIFLDTTLANSFGDFSKILTLTGIPENYNITSTQTSNNNTSEFSNPIGIPPGAPQNLAATGGDLEVTLNWTPNTESDLHKYNIYRGTSFPATILIDSVIVSTSADTTYIDNNVAANTTYYYRITAVDSSGSESNYSNEVNATPFETKVTVITPNGGENWQVGNTYEITWKVSSLLAPGNKIGGSSETIGKKLKSEKVSSVKKTVSFPHILSNITNININGKTILKSTRLNRIKKQISISSSTGLLTESSIEDVKIEYSINNGSSWSEIISSVPVSTGSYSWTIPDTRSNECLVKISDVSDGSITDQSDAAFTIYQQTVTLTSPNGGEEWLVGSKEEIVWRSENVDSIKLEYTIDNGIIWRKVIPESSSIVAASNSSYTWEVSDNPSEECKVRITSTSNSNIRDESDSTFKIVQDIVVQTLEVTSPIGGEEWNVNSSHNITWLSNEVENVKIDYSTDNGVSWIEIIASITASTESYPWTLPDIPSDNCLVRVSDTDGDPSDVSNETFKIIQEVVVSTVEVTSPNGTENWIVGSTYNILWNSKNVDNVKISYSTNNGDTWPIIIESTQASDGLYEWVVPNEPSTECLVLVTNLDNEDIWDHSDGMFTIAPSPTLSVTTPNGGEIWTSGTSQNITWTSEYVDNVKIEYSINSGTSWITIENSISVSTSPYTWIVPEIESENCLVKISDISNNLINDLSDSEFTIVLPPFVTIIYPNGNEMYNVGGEVTIIWDSRNVEQITLESSVNGNADWTPIATDLAANNKSYTWTIPNTPSVDCLIKIVSSGDSNLNDQSDETFVIYPTTVPVVREVSFGNVDADESFRMIGLPGNGNFSLSNVMQGEYGTKWKAYFDNGKEGAQSDYLEEYDGSSKFSFKPGLGFWIVAAENLKINETFESVPVNDGYATIALNSGWNVISNPFELAVEWKEVTLLNELNNASDVIYDYNGTYSISTTFEPYSGYYYLNDAAGVTSLKIPYHSNDAGGLAKAKNTVHNDITLKFNDSKLANSFVKFGFREDAQNEFDKYDIYFPRYIGSEGIVISNSLHKNLLIEDYRKEIGEGVEYNLQLNLKPNKNYRLNITGLENYQDLETILIDTRLSKVYYFIEEMVTIKSLHKENSFKFLVGTSDFIENEIRNLVPKEYLLYQNYPNPFNPSTVIRFALPKESKVELKIYSVIGEEIKTLIPNQSMSAGNHEVEFRATILASGVYFYRIIADGFTDVKKLVLIK